MGARAYSSNVAFTSSVKAVQTRKGSRRSYARVEERGGWQTRISPDLARFIEAQTSISGAKRGQNRDQTAGGILNPQSQRRVPNLGATICKEIEAPL